MGYPGDCALWWDVTLLRVALGRSQGFKTWAKVLGEQAPEMATTQITKQQMEVDYLPKCTPEQTNRDTWWTATLKLQSMLNRSLISSSTMRTQYLLQPNTWGKKDEKWQFVHRFILLKTVPKYLKGINPYNRKISAEKRWNTNILLINGKFQLSPSPGDQGRMWEVKEDGKTFFLCISVFIHARTLAGFILSY